MNQPQLLEKISSVTLIFKEKNSVLLSKPLRLYLNELYEKPIEFLHNNNQHATVTVSYKPFQKGVLLTIDCQSSITLTCLLCHKTLNQQLNINTSLYLTDHQLNQNQLDHSNYQEHIVLNKNSTLKDVLKDEIYLNLNQYPRHASCNILELSHSLTTNPFKRIKHLVK